MAVSISGTTLTFNDATTQTTARTASNTVTSIVAGTGITVSGATGAVTVNAAGSGTVTSVATGNGLSGGTITTSGTLTIAAPSINSVGSYAFCSFLIPGGCFPRTITTDTTYSAGTAWNQIRIGALVSGGTASGTNSLSGTWRWMSATITAPTVCNNSYVLGVGVRVS